MPGINTQWIINARWKGETEDRWITTDNLDFVEKWEKNNNDYVYEIDGPRFTIKEDKVIWSDGKVTTYAGAAILRDDLIKCEVKLLKETVDKTHYLNFQSEDGFFEFIPASKNWYWGTGILFGPRFTDAKGALGIHANENSLEHIMAGCDASPEEILDSLLALFD